MNLRVTEKEDLPLVAEWMNNLEFSGEYERLRQLSKSELQKGFDSKPQDVGAFFIEKKDGTKIGGISHRPQGKAQELGFEILPNERRKGFCSEAVMIMVDYLFLSKDIPRIQAHTDARNAPAQKVLEKAGFKKEGTFKKEFFVGGEWRDSCIFAVLREEWKEPKILTKIA